MEKKILFVDDEEVILMTLTASFRCLGYSPFSTTSGIEAMEIMKREHIRVIFTDLRMPIMNGMELCRQAREIDPGAYVYAVSAFVKAYEAGDFEKTGFRGYFLKPFVIDELVEVARKAFEILEQEEG